MTRDPIRLEQQADRAAGERRFADAAQLLVEATTAGGDRADLWSKLSAMRRISGDLAGALTAIERALALSPLDFASLLARAMLLEKVQPEASGEAYCEAIGQLPAQEAVPPAMQQAVATAKARCDQHREAIERRLNPLIPGRATGSDQARLQRFVGNVTRRTKAYAQEPTHFHYPEMPAVEFHDPSAFPGLDAFADLTPVIRQELDTLLAAEGAELVPYIQYPDRIALRQWEALNRNRNWSAFHLLQNGYRVESNARHCPRTLQALASLDQPVVAGASPNAMFSLLAPRTRIPPHTGVANTRLVAHLPLIVPPGCGFRCGATTVEWVPGQPFVFDDTIEHEAWNDSDELRIVLIFDLWAPGLSSVEREAIAQIIPAAGKAPGAL